MPRTHITLVGDIIAIAENGGYDYVLQNCNCQNRMGSGVALTIAEAWPEVEKADQRTGRGDPRKLGTYDTVNVIRGAVSFTVVNLYGQFRYGPAFEQHFDYGAFEHACTEFAKTLPDERCHIVFPLLGTGTAGGRWPKVRNILEAAFEGHELTLVRKGRKVEPVVYKSEDWG